MGAGIVWKKELTAKRKDLSDPQFKRHISKQSPTTPHDNPCGWQFYPVLLQVKDLRKKKIDLPKILTRSIRRLNYLPNVIYMLPQFIKARSISYH
jgi:hypothetical protein